MSYWLKKDFDDVKNILDTQFNYKPTSKQESLLKRLHRSVFCSSTLIYEITKKETERMDFLKEVHSDLLELLVVVPLGLKRSAFLSLRAAIEHTILHIYYKDHPVELLWLNESSENRLDTKRLFKYFNDHPLYRGDKLLSFRESIREEYSRKSEFVHGTSLAFFQKHKTISEIKVSDIEFEELVQDVHQLVDSLMTAIILFHKDTFSGIHSSYATLIMSHISDGNKRIIYKT